MTKYRKKPIVIEVIQFTGSNYEEIIKFVNDHPARKRWLDITELQTPVIHTLEGDMFVGNGDWIIKGIQGEFYPCKSDIFEATYELAD